MYIVKPVITEKAYNLAQNGVYTFRFDQDLKKPEIVKCIVDQYGVHVSKIRTIKMAGKTKRVGKTRRVVQVKGWKKAYVTLNQGESLDLFSAKEQ